MKKYLLPNDQNCYKANLHCHTVFSDGKYTPQEVKQAYMEQGYSIIAYTDHDLFVPHNELSDENFLALNGFEGAFDEPKTPQKPTWRENKNCHVGYIALDKSIDKNPICYKSRFDSKLPSEYKKYALPEKEAGFQRIHTIECISEANRIAHENGFFCIMNHPCWSLEEYPDYMGITNFDAFEMTNYGSLSYVGSADIHYAYLEPNQRIMDDILKSGRNIYCVNADDNHGDLCRFGGFIYIYSKDLTYENVANSLKNGVFYASEGPKINSLWIENNTVYVECDNARSINFTTGARHAKRVINEDKTSVSSGKFTIREDDMYVRVTITDFNGKSAYTNAFYVEDIFEKQEVPV